MGTRFRTRDAPRSPQSEPVASPPQATVRPGLPLQVLEGDSATATDRAGSDEARLSAVADAARVQRELRGDPPPETDQTDSQAADGGAEAAADAAADAGHEGAEATGGDGTGRETQAEGPPQPAGSGPAGDRRATPAQVPRREAPRIHRKVDAPVIPRVEMPDRAYIRSPVVPSPPAAAVEKRLDILQSTGSLPEDHHAAVQRAVDEVADAARTAQRNVVFQVGTTAAHARGDIEALARRVPDVIGAQVGRIRAAALAVSNQLDGIANRQIRLFMKHVRENGGRMGAAAHQTEQRMHDMLMRQAPEELREAKRQMDAALTRHAADARGRIEQVKTGRQPDPLETGDAVGDTARAEAAAENPSRPIEAPTPPTWDQAQSDIADGLGRDLPENRLTQYGNLRCASALPGLVTQHREAYETANDATQAAVASPQMQRQFFDATMGLTLPTLTREQQLADRVDDSAYIGSFTGKLGRQFMRLTADQRAVVRQIDEKRNTLKTQTLNPDNEKSLPHMGIKGVREAGEKIQQGLMDQARVVEASLRVNIAALSSEYPEIVARLMPIIDTGGFLEASETLDRIVEARRSVGIMEAGHLGMVADQARQAVRQARKGFDTQMASLRKSATKSVQGINQFGARAHFDLVRTGAAYTGIVDEGVRAALPQILAHAETTARRLLGPKTNAGQGFSNIETAAVVHLNGAISGEWQGYLSRLKGLEKALGGVETGSIVSGASDATEFGRIRQGAKADAVDRAQKIESEMTPAPLDNSDRVLLYGGAALAAPFTLGASAGVLAYDIYSDPDESDIVTHLSVPWPGPPAIDQAQTEIRRRESLQSMIRERLKSEGEQQDILGLFSSDAGTREQSKTNLIIGSDTIGGISGDAALALTQSYTSEELSSEFMSAADRQRMADALAGSLKNADQREIAAAYLNGQPDQALAIRMRVLFDSQRGKEYNNQLQTGAELDKLIRQELFGGGQYAYIPPSELARMRDAAFLRFDEVSREGRQRVTVNANAPDQAAVTSGGVSPTQIRTTPPPEPAAQTRTPAAPDSASPGDGATPTQSPSEEPAGTAAQTPAQTPSPTPSQAPQQPASGGAARQPAAPQPAAAGGAQQPTATQRTGRPQVGNDTNADREARRARDLDTARQRVVAYMNRPTSSVNVGQRNPHIERNMEANTRYDPRHRSRSYDPETGRLTYSPAAAIQDYNRAMILHGTTSPEARGARAAASMAWMSRSGEPSTNEINQLNENFSDEAYNSMRLRWQAASPAERDRMRPQWEEAQRDHRTFLRTAAQHMGMDADRLDDPRAVAVFVTNRLGDQFARIDGDFRQAGREIVTQGRMSIDTGVDMAAEGWGTNEQLMQNVMANRSQAEWNQRRADGRTMRQHARRVASSEMSGDDWQQAREKLRGPDENDFQRADTARWLIDQQLDEGTGWLSSMTMSGSWQQGDLHRRRGEVDDRLLTAARAGMEEARRRGIEVPDDLDTARMPDGSLHPLVRQWAMDGDGALRGSGPTMGTLVSDTRQSADYYRAEIDRQEGIFTSIITALAVVASIAALLIPGVNAVAAGILVALLSGAATVAVKSGMRGGRYGWEEAAVDVGTAAIEAATAGAGGALSKGARVANAARAAKAAGDAVEVATAAQRMSQLGRLGRAGAALSNRLGPTGAAVVQETVTGAISSSANAAMNDQMWDDGMGTGLLRMAGHGFQGAAASAVNVGLSSKVTKGLDARLAPVVADPQTAGKLNRIGARLSGNGRELLTEVVAGLSGSLSSEGVNILADLARHPDKMTLNKALERLGKSGLKELLSTSGKTMVQQHHRARANDMSARIMAEGRDPSPTEARLLTRLSQSGGLLPPEATTADYAARFSAARARIAGMPPDLQPHLQRMSPDKAMEVVRMLDSGQLGTRKQRMEFTAALGKEVVGLDVAAFDRLLVRSNAEHAPERRARKAQVKQAGREMLSGVRGPEREAMKRLDFDELAGLPADLRRALAKELASDAPDFRRIADDALQGDPGQRRRVLAQLDAAAGEIARARSEVAVRRARIRDDLTAGANARQKAVVAGLKPRDAAALHRHLNAGPDGEARAVAVLRQAGLDPADARAMVGQMAGRVMEQASRRLYMDNVPELHREAMAQLTPDALMEIRVAQFTKTPLDAERIEAILADVKQRRPGADLDALREAIRATVSTRHGRPGFRDALAQKRAFLDLVPFGMKREVLRTPLIVLPDHAFLSFVQGKGNESAVTLIVGGKPVVLMRSGADPKRLGEEGLHVLQYHDPEFRGRLAGLDEAQIARWGELTLNDQIAAYGAKVDIEIDAQQRTIGRLRQRAEAALWPGTRRKALEQLQQAETALQNLTARRDELAGFSPERRQRIEMGLEERPGWLAQPARMFNKGEADDALVHRHLPSARAPVRQAYYDLTRRVGDLPRTERKRLLNLLRVMKGAVTMEELTETLAMVNSGSRKRDQRHLQKLPPDQVVDAVRDHLFGKIRGTDIDARSEGLKARLRARVFADTPEDDARLRQLFEQTIDELTRQDTGGSQELRVAKQAMFLALEEFPATTTSTRLKTQLELTAKVLGVGDARDAIPGLRRRPRVQAFILEALATNNQLLLAQHAPNASQAALIRAVTRLIDDGIQSYTPAAQRAAFETLARAYFARAGASTLDEISRFPKVLADQAGGDLRHAREALKTALEFLAHQPAGQYADGLRKIGALLEHVVDLRVRPEGSAIPAGRITIKQINAYMRAAIRESSLAASVIVLGHRARQRTRDGLDPLSPRDHQALVDGKPVVAGQEGFLDRHAAPLKGRGRGTDVTITREEVAEGVMARAQALDSDPDAPTRIDLTVEEARAIGKRLEVLEHTGLFSALLGRPGGRDRLLDTILRELDAGGLTPVAGASRAEIETRGQKIEDAFRHFVREIASSGGKPVGAGRDLPLLEALARGAPIKSDAGEITLSEAARTELVMILVRGDRTGKDDTLPPSVRAEVEAIKTLMIETQVARLGDEHTPKNRDLVRESLWSMIEEGIASVERSGKGKMLEHLVEGLMALDSSTGGAPPLFDAVQSATATVTHRFNGVDESAGERSLDNVLRIGAADDLPAGLARGDAVGMDCKNGPGAFTPSQFRRYLFEMLKGAQADPNDPSIFDPSGADKSRLKALLYVADSPENAAKARQAAIDVIQEILDSHDPARGKVQLGLGDPPIEIDWAVLRAHADSLNVFFSHIGQPPTEGGSGHQLGPFRILANDQTVAAMIRAKAADLDPDAGS